MCDSFTSPEVSHFTVDKLCWIGWCGRWSRIQINLDRVLRVESKELSFVRVQSFCLSQIGILSLADLRLMLKRQESE